MRGARYVRLIPWTLHSGSEQYTFWKLDSLPVGEALEQRWGLMRSAKICCYCIFGLQFFAYLRRESQNLIRCGLYSIHCTLNTAWNFFANLRIRHLCSRVIIHVSGPVRFLSLPLMGDTLHVFEATTEADVCDIPKGLHGTSKHHIW